MVLLMHGAPAKGEKENGGQSLMYKHAIAATEPLTAAALYESENDMMPIYGGVCVRPL